MITNAIIIKEINITTVRIDAVAHIVIPVDSIETVQDHQANSEDSTKVIEARALSVIIQETVLIDPVHQVDPVTETGDYIGATSTHVPIHSFATCHVFVVAVRNKPWKATNVHIHWNILRRT